MMTRYIHVYSMTDEPDRVRATVPEHVAYWRRLALPGYIGGPFADRSGGLITFEATSVEDAHRIIAADPFVREGLVSDSLVKPWVPE